MTGPPGVTPFAARLAADLILALLGQGVFTTPGRPEGRQALEALYDGLIRQFRSHVQIALLADRPSAPPDFWAWGLAPCRVNLARLFSTTAPSVLPHFAGAWHDRRLLLLSLRRGLARQEFVQLFHLIAQHGSNGPALRKRWLEARLQGGLPHATLLFTDDLVKLDQGVPWPVQVALSWLLREFNRLPRQIGLPAATQAAARQEWIATVLELASGPGERRDLLAHLDRIVEDLQDCDRDEFAALLLAAFEPAALPGACLELCGLIERLQQRAEQKDDAAVRERLGALRWVARRVAEQMLESGTATPEHYHALVLQKVLLYDEMPDAVRGRVATLQVLTSFLANPHRYFTEIEESHSPEVLEKRLWRLLEMLPNMVRVCRFDAVREVVAFVRRYGPTFDLSRNQGLLNEVREASAEVLASGETAQQAELMKILPQMGRTGMHLLIDLADHPQRSVRRVAFDGLCSAGPVAVPILFEVLEHKPGWHYLRNMLMILGKVGVGGPRIEELFRQALMHPEAGVRKEALPGMARLFRENAAEPVAGRLDDADPEVRRRAIVCLGMTGIANLHVYDRLAEVLVERRANEMALAVVATLNRLRPGDRAGTRMETALIQLVGGGWFGLARGGVERSLRLEAIKALGQFRSERARKTLERLLKESDVDVARAAREVLASGG